MPTYVYKCSDCETKYEIFHKSSEKSEDIKCPECGSKKSDKLIAAANIGGAGKNAPSMPQAPSCASGMCGLN
jgi:putative FmdB family regulatory protein